jgi:hypothetical protein
VRPAARGASKIVVVPCQQAYDAGFRGLARLAPDISKIQGPIGYGPLLDLPETWSG